jgi:hypothetical protein
MCGVLFLALWLVALTDFSDFVVLEVLTTAGMKMAVFWVVAPCSVVEIC